MYTRFYCPRMKDQLEESRFKCPHEEGCPIKEEDLGDCIYQQILTALRGVEDNTVPRDR